MSDKLATTDPAQKFWSRASINTKQPTQLRKLAARLRRALTESTEYSKPNMVPVALVAIIGFPLYYIIWAVVFPQPYENLGLRLFGAVLCIPLLLHRQLSPVLRRYLSIYWFFILLYSIPVFLPFLLFNNYVSLILCLPTMMEVVC